MPNLMERFNNFFKLWQINFWLTFLVDTVYVNGCFIVFMFSLDRCALFHYHYVFCTYI